MAVGMKRQQWRLKTVKLLGSGLGDCFSVGIKGRRDQRSLSIQQGLSLFKNPRFLTDSRSLTVNLTASARSLSHQ